MNHAITIGGLLSFMAIVAGVLIGAGGVFVLFAAGMSTVPDDHTGRVGCIIMLIGAALLAAGIMGAIQ